MVRFLRLPAGLAALAGVALSLAVHVASIRGIDTEATSPNVWLLQVALFPLAILAVLTAGVVADQEERLRFRDFVALIPMPARVLVVLCFVYAIATLLIFTPLSGAGAPIVKDGRFFFDNHGAIREVTNPSSTSIVVSRCAFFPVSGSICISFQPPICSAQGDATARALNYRPFRVDRPHCEDANQIPMRRDWVDCERGSIRLNGEFQCRYALLVTFASSPLRPQFARRL